MRTLLLALLMAHPPATERLEIDGEPELVRPGIVSTEKSEIKPTFSPDGRRMLWGTIGWEGGAGGWDVWESVRDGKNGEWGAPHAVTFDSEANDFDPSFSPDGREVYFFSNRAGGLGGDDIYSVAFDVKTGTYGKPANVGSVVNTPADEWGPTVSPDGRRLLFCSNGRGGAGAHDLFVCERAKGAWGEAKNLGAANGPLEDFDAAFLDGGRAIVFASGDLENGPVMLFVSFLTKDGSEKPVALPAAVTSKTFMNFGCATSASEPGVLYFTSNFAGNNRGRSDIYRVRYRIRS